MKNASRGIATAVGMVMLFAGTALAQTEPVKCSSQITACGCTISVMGSYTVENELDYSQGLTLKGGCIDIAASNVDLSVVFNVSGPGDDPMCAYSHPRKNAGVGIHVLPGAEDVSIYSGVFCGWNDGLESEGSNIKLAWAGSYFNNVGMLLNNATGNVISDSAFNNNTTGLEITGGSGNSITDGWAIENAQYGYWLNGTQGNTFSSAAAELNTIAGFYLGCNSTGNVKPLIPCTTNLTTGNSLLGTMTYGTPNSPFAERYGIAVERESIYNTFIGDENYLDLSNRNKIDIIDGNGNCVYNTYRDDTYVTKWPGCIQ